MRRHGPREPVVVHQVRVEQRDTDQLLSCQLRSRDATLPQTLWFRFAGEAGLLIPSGGDPFLPPLLLHCLKTGVPLAIEADVSARLMSAVAPIQDLYCTWEAGRGVRWTPIAVSAEAVARRRHASSSAAFFSGGVDSFYTLVRNLERHPPGDSRHIHTLVLVHGFDIALADRGLFEQVREQARNVAREFNKRLMTVETNVRAATRLVDWGQYGHGAGLASVGLALGRLVDRVYIPSTSALVELTPWGTHPALDPLWSTEEVEFVHDGADAARHDKIRTIASTAALQSLRVCWENRGGAYNCGRCEKCLRTMIELHLCGALDRARQFPDAISPADVERLAIPPNCRKYWHRILDERERLGSHTLAAAIQAALDRSATAGQASAPIHAIGRRLSHLLRRVRRRAASSR